MFDLLYPLIQFLVGASMLYFGSDYLVDNSSLLAKRNNISPLIIGVTVIAFGTSLPELVVSVNAAFNNFPDLILGNIVGSNISNICLVLGLILVLYNFKVLDFSNSKRNLFSLFIITLLFAILILILDKLNFYTSLLFSSLFLLYLYIIFKNQSSDYPNEELNNVKLIKILFLIISGLLLVVFGSDFFIKGAVGIANFLQIEKSIIGLTVVALATSIPELFVSINAAIKKEYDFIFGNVIGSNIFNITLVGGLVGFLKDITYDSSDYFSSLLVLSIVTLLLVFLFIQKIILNKILGSVFIIIYFIFLYINFI